MNTMKKILVCYDRSTESKKALSLALEIVKDTECEIALLFVRSQFDKSFIEGEDVTEADAKNQIKEMMKETIKTILRSKVKVEGVILKGDPAQKILDYSNKNDLDLILIGATGIGSEEDYKLGSVAEKVVRYCTKPVLVAK
jgi:nucleotide-binding universal stress UspA family protein